MTGFTTWLRKILLLGPAKDRWTERSGQDHDCNPVRLKLSVRNAQQFEIKLVYQLNPHQEQHYSCEVFLFFSSELASGDLGFYHNLWSTVKLHTPKAELASLSNAGPSSQLQQIASAIQALQQRLQPLDKLRQWEQQVAKPLVGHTQQVDKVATVGRKAEAEIADLVSDLLQLLRLYCCSFRRSLRHATKRLHGQMKTAKASGKEDAAEKADAGMDSVLGLVIDLVRDTSNAVRAMELVSSSCEDKHMPPECHETWSLCKEYLLCESERALMKLLWELQKGCTVEKPECVIDVALSTDVEGERAQQPLGLPLPSPELIVASEPLQGCSQESFIQDGTSTSSMATRGTGEGNPGDRIGLHERACQVLSKAVHGFQEKREACGFIESTIYDDSESHNEKYTNRIKVLKRNAQAATSLTPQKQNPSNVLADTVGMTIAALAMGVATFSVYAATHWAGSQYGAIYIMIIIGAYVIKDRMKEWGKRYLQPIAEWFGMEFPDTITKFEDDQRVTVGKSQQFSTVREDTAIDKRVLQMRWQCSWIPTQRHATNPEKVLVYKKRMHVHWKRINTKLQAVTGLDDVMRFDLHHFCRRMVEAEEVHYKLASKSGVKKIKCARVYHLNLVLRVKTRGLPDRNQDARNTNKVMHMERARLVVNQQGIQRLQSLGTLPMEKPVPPFTADSFA